MQDVEYEAGKQKDVVTPEEMQLASSIRFDAEVCRIAKVRTGGELQRLQSYDDVLQRLDADGVSISVAENEVQKNSDTLRDELTSRGYRVYQSEICVPNGSIESPEIVILKKETIRIRSSELDAPMEATMDCPVTT